MRPVESIDSRIVIVGITEQDLQRLNQYKIDDGTLAEVIQKIKDRNPRAIGLNIHRNLPVCFTPDTCESDREKLASILRNTNNLIGIETVGEDSISSHPELFKANRTGASETIEDTDRVVRRSYLSVVDRAGEDVYSFGLDVALKYLEKENINLVFAQNKLKINQTVFLHIGSNGGSFPTQIEENSPFKKTEDRLINFINKLALHNFYPQFSLNLDKFPPRFSLVNETDPNQILLNYRQSKTPFKTLSISQVLSQDFDEGEIRDKIVLIGSVHELSGDIFYVPYLESKRNFIYGVELQAQIVSYLINAVLEERTVFKFLPAPAELVLITFLLGESFLFIYWLDKKQQTISTLLTLSGIQIIVILVSGALSLYFGYWLPSIALLFIIFVNLAGLSVLIYHNRQEAEKSKLEKQVQQKTQDLQAALANLQKVTKEAIKQEKLDLFLASTAFLDHEIKNPLGLILVSSDAVAAQAYSLVTSSPEFNSGACLSPPSPAVEYDYPQDTKRIIASIITNNANIREQAQRINSLLKLVDTQSYQKQEDLSRISIDDLIDKVWSIAWHTFNKLINSELEVEIVREKSDPKKKVNVYPKSLEVALINIINNGLYSLLQKKKSHQDFQPRIKIKTQRDPNYLTITIEDNGIGIDRKHYQDIFQEFYSTKENSLGFGLPITKQIIELQHQGSISLASKLGVFTRFIIKIPANLKNN